MKTPYRRIHFALVVAFTIGCIEVGRSSGEEAVLRALDGKTVIAKVRPSVATIRVMGRDGDQLGVGTGFVIDKSGLIVTNFHVINEGREFSVTLSSGRRLPVLAVEASDRASDLVLIRVDVGDAPLSALSLADPKPPEQGIPVFAFGNPLGLRDSVVTGIVSAVRDVEGHELIQLAIPIEPGNSGGPLVDSSGNVLGIINMKSAVDENLGFAIPIKHLLPLRDKPNPVTIDRWVRLGRISEKNWTPLFGALWQDRGGVITARGVGTGFGGRSLCLSTTPAPELPFEVAVQVRLDDESGAAGIAFHSDAADKHYGFYPSAGRLRLTCFQGPSVYSWQVLEEVESDHYLRNQWNRIRVRIEKDRFQCFLNGHMVIESNQTQLPTGRFGLVKFRDTNPDFKGFQYGKELSQATLSDDAQRLFTEIVGENSEQRLVWSSSQLKELGQSGTVAANKLVQRALELERQAQRLRRLAADVELAPTLVELRKLLSDGESDQQLLRGALLIAKMDNLDIDVTAYENRVDEMAAEIRQTFEKGASDIDRRNAMHRYLFQENGFHGGRAEYYHVANSHLNRVIDDREGLPITLSILYMELGKRLDLEIEGIGLPGHFVVKHVTEAGEQLVDVFEAGKLMSRREAKRVVAAYAGRPLQGSDLRAQSTVEILSRVLNNLMGVASGQEDTEAMNRYCEALVAVDPESTESRMLRSQIRAMTGRQVGAIEDLDWLMEKDPPGFNRVRAQRLRESLLE